MSNIFDIEFESQMSTKTLALLNETFAINVANAHDSDRAERGIGIVTIDGDEVMVVLTRPGRQWRITAFPNGVDPSNVTVAKLRDMAHHVLEHA